MFPYFAKGCYNEISIVNNYQYQSPKIYVLGFTASHSYATGKLILKEKYDPASDTANYLKFRTVRDGSYYYLDIYFSNPNYNNEGRYDPYFIRCINYTSSNMYGYFVQNAPVFYSKTDDLVSGESLMDYIDGSTTPDEIGAITNSINNDCFRKNNNASITDLNTISPGAVYNFIKANVSNLPRDAGNAEVADVLTLGKNTQKYQLYCGGRTNKIPILAARKQYGNDTSGWGEWGTIPIGLLDFKSFIQSGSVSDSLVKFTDEFIASSPNYSLEQAIHFILVQRTIGGGYSLYIMIGYSVGSKRSRIIPIYESSLFQVTHYSTENDGRWFKVITSQTGYKVTIIGVGTNRLSYYDKLEMVPYTES